MTELILFDIDATLLLTGGAGMTAIGEAGRTLYGPHFTTEGIQFAGRLDPLLVDELFTRHNVERTTENRSQYRTTYARHLEERLAKSAAPAALPGTIELVLRLHERPSPRLGLLTGNFAETGSMKLRRCGFDPGWFPISVWGDDSPHTPPARDHLPVVAFERFKAAHGRSPDPARVTIIGDTPHDVRCAKVNGCRALAVATGSFSRQALLDAGADRVVDTLSATDDLAHWLVHA